MTADRQIMSEDLSHLELYFEGETEDDEGKGSGSGTA